MFSATVLDHFTKPHNRGAMTEAGEHLSRCIGTIGDVAGSEGFPGEGPHMVIYLRIAREGTGDRIREARFETYGCPAAIACGSWLTQWLVGKTLETAGQIEADELAIAVGGLPLGKEHCAELAVNALRSAIRKARAKVQSVSPVGKGY